jgi:hypothetical protein
MKRRSKFPQRSDKPSLVRKLSFAGVIKGMSLKLRGLSLPPVRRNRLACNEGNTNGACPSLDPSQTIPTPHCGQLSLMESVNQELGKTPATIRLDDLTPLLKSLHEWTISFCRNAGKGCGTPRCTTHH